MIVRLITVALCFALLAACQAVVNPPEADDTTFRLDEPIALAPGETATLEDAVLETTIELTFVQIRSDSRCPDAAKSDVMCVWSGAVEVEMTAIVNGQTETFALIGITDYDGVVEGSIVSETDSTIWYFAGYHFELIQVIPYPVAENRPLPEDYVTTVVIRRVAEPLPTPTDAVASITHLIDEAGKPVLCVSEKAMAQWAAGATEEEPSQLTPPLAGKSLPNIEAADEICAVLFGEGWRIAALDDIDGMWAEFVPTDLKFWIWDIDTDSIRER